MLSFEKRLKYVKEIENAINTDLDSIPNVLMKTRTASFIN